MLSQDCHGLVETSSAQARLGLLLTHLTHELERLRVVEVAAPGHKAEIRGQACDTPEPSRSRSLTGGKQAGLAGAQLWLGWGKHWEPIKETVIHRSQTWLDPEFRGRHTWTLVSVSI